MAIKGFEDIMHELSEWELEVLVPMLHGVLSNHKGKAKAITNADLRQHVLDRFGKRIAEPRIRKVAEYMRQTNLLEGLLAGRYGYFVAETPEEIDEWLLTMKQRRNALTNSIIAGERCKRRMTGYRQPNQYKKLKPRSSFIQPNLL